MPIADDVKTYDEVREKYRPFMETAKVWACQSKCSKRKVGAVIFNIKTGRLLSTGYNGTFSGMCNCQELFARDGFSVHARLLDYVKLPYIGQVGWTSVAHDMFCKLHKEFSAMYETHAEQNAILNMLKAGVGPVDFNDIGICVTLEPCVQCAKEIISLGIKHIIYLEEHTSSHSQVKDMFMKAGVIEYEQF